MAKKIKIPITPWNECHFCECLVDAEDIAEGKEATCGECGRAYVYGFYIGTGWVLRPVDISILQEG